LKKNRKIDFAPFGKIEIDYALIYNETKIDSALPKFGKRKKLLHMHCNKEEGN